jgi:DNA polymerase-3 subunit alpha
MEKEPVHFVHLHTHSHYSLLDGLSKVDKMIALAKEHDMPAVALTDHGAMYGAIDFYQTAVKAGVKPILGVETYVAFRTRHDKEPGIDNKIYHLTLLAKNNKGYQNLISLVTKAHLEGYYYKPRVDKDLLRMYSEGVIALSGCFGGELSRALRSRDHDRAVAIALEYQEIFGKENYYIEIMHKPEIEGHDEVEDALVALARELDIPLVATHDSHYLHKEDKKAHETLLGIQTGGVGGVDDGMKFEFDASFISTKEALALFPKTPDAVYNTAKIAAECNVELTLGKFIFPDFALEPGKTADQMLDELTQKGAKERGLSNDTVSEERRKYELEVIKNKNYAPYFLVVADLLRFAREAGIYTTVRGSAAGSHVAYLSGITNVDPIEFQLPFERFLNPFRPSAPDIDMDFADNRREEVIEYAKRKYGSDKVAQIGTFGTMMARGSVRDVARALGKPYDVGDKISKLIPMGSQGFPMTIEHALDLEPDLKKMYGTDPAARRPPSQGPGRDARDGAQGDRLRLVQLQALRRRLESAERDVCLHRARGLRPLPAYAARGTGGEIGTELLVEKRPRTIDKRAVFWYLQRTFHNRNRGTTWLLPPNSSVVTGNIRTSAHGSRKRTPCLPTSSPRPRGPIRANGSRTAERLSGSQLTPRSATSSDRRSGA